MRIPNLEKPPDLKCIQIRRLSNELFKEAQGNSSTGWVNFATVVRAYGMQYESSGKVMIHRAESFLPVHRTWLLLLGVADRYAKRVDLGLFESEAKEPGVDDFGHSPLCGLSGILAYKSQGWHEELQGQPGSVCFRMHSATHMNRMTVVRDIDNIPLGKLFFLYLGYIPRREGDVYAIKAEEQPDHVNLYGRNDYSESEHVVWEITSTGNGLIAHDHGSIMRDLSIDIPKVYCLTGRKRIINVEVDERREMSSFSGNEIYYHLVAGESIHRTDMYCVLRSILELGGSPHSFLYNHHARGGKGLIQKMFAASESPDAGHDLKELLHLSMQATKLLDMECRPAVLEAISAVLERFQIPPLPWSRGLLKRYFDLDMLLIRYCETKRFITQTISILYMLDRHFRALCIHPAQAILNGSLVLNRVLKTVEIYSHASIEPEQATTFNFDFNAVFPDWHTQENLEVGESISLTIPYPDVMIACLRGQMIMAMWDMSLPSDHLSDFYTQLDRVVRIGASSEAPRRRSALEAVLQAGSADMFEALRASRLYRRDDYNE